jgi:hypothetical protein
MDFRYSSIYFLKYLLNAVKTRKVTDGINAKQVYLVDRPETLR